jgi:hypothetical protein
VDELEQKRQAILQGMDQQMEKWTQEKEKLRRSREQFQQENQWRDNVIKGHHAGRVGSGGFGLFDPLMTRNQIRSDEGRAAFVDGWVRKSVAHMEDSWALFYEGMRIIKESEFYKNAYIIDDKTARATFQEYYEAVAQKPFQTWVDLEADHHFIHDLDPELLRRLTYSEAKAMRAATNTTPEVVPSGQGARTDIPDSGKCTQSSRSRSNGVSPDTQRKLDRIARERPDLREQIIAGKLSITGAMIAAGWEIRRMSVRLDPDLAAEVLERAFPGERLEDLIRKMRAIRGGES